MNQIVSSVVLYDHGGALAISDGKSQPLYVRPAASQVPWQRAVFWDREPATHAVARNTYSEQSVVISTCANVS